MPRLTHSRRAFLGTAAFGVLSVAQTRPGDTAVAADETFTFEIQRTEAEWRAMLTDAEFAIMREGATEPAKSSPWWQSREEGSYACKGCDLPLYVSRWQTYPDIGWVFFRQSVPNAVMMGIDQSNPYGGSAEMVPDELALIETHCRRCGSHLGHIIAVRGDALHCINGTSLTFNPAEA